MNRLKKKAWRDFWIICVMSLVALSSFGFLTLADIKGAKGAKYLTIALAYVGLSIGFMFFQNRRKCKKQNAPEFDEREFYLIQRAINIGNNIFIIYVLLALVIAFYLVGGHGMVPMWSIPLVLFWGIFLCGTVQSLILMHYAKEDNE